MTSKKPRVVAKGNLYRPNIENIGAFRGCRIFNRLTVSFWQTNIVFCNIDRLLPSDALNLEDAALEFVVRDDGAVLDPGLVGIDRVHGILEDLGDLFVVRDAQADEGEDAEIDIEELIFLELYLVFFFK